MEGIFGDLDVLSGTQRSHLPGIGIRRDKGDPFKWSWKDDSDALRRKAGYLKRTTQQIFTEHLLCARYSSRDSR